jgi:hypothetical protein
MLNVFWQKKKQCANEANHDQQVHKKMLQEIHLREVSALFRCFSKK